MDTQDVVFSEVLQLTLDKEGFSTGLAEVEREYKAFLEEIQQSGGSGADISNIAGIGSLVRQIDSLTSEMKTFTDSMAQNLGAVANALIGQVDGVAKKVEESSTAAVSSAGEAASTIAESSAERIERVWQSLTEGTKKQASISQMLPQEQLAVWERVQDQIADQGTEFFEQLSAANRKAIQNITTMVGPLEQAASDAMAAPLKNFQSIMEKRDLEQATANGRSLAEWEKYADALTAIDQRRDVEMATLRGKQLAEEQKTTDKLSAISQKRQYEEYNAAAAADQAQIKMNQEFIQMLQNRDVEEANLRGKQMVEDQKTANIRSGIEQRRQTDEYRSAQELEFKLEKLDLDAQQAKEKSDRARELSDSGATDKIRANAQKLSEAYTILYEEILEKHKLTAEQAARIEIDKADRAIAEAQRQANEVQRILSQSQKPTKSEPESRSIFETVSGLVAWQVEWVAATALIEAAIAPVKAFVDTIKQGFDYTSEMEERIADLQGVIASNVKFATDQAENFRLAGVAARGLKEQIEDYAIKYGLGIDSITRGFKNFVDNGGVSLTRSVDDALQVSVLFAASLKAAGKNADDVRSMLSEVPKLLDGTIQNSSKILDTLGLTKEEWASILSQSKEHHDLLQRLQPILENYTKVAEDSKDRFSAIKEELGLIYDRTSALIAQQFWPDLKDLLKDIKQYLADNKSLIDQIAIAIGNALDDLLKLVNVRNLLDLMVAGIRQFTVELIVATSLFRQMKALVDVIANGILAMTSFDLGNIRAYLNNLKQAAKEFDVAKDSADGQIYVLQHPDQYREPPKDKPDIPVIGGKGTENNTKQKKDTQELTSVTQAYRAAVSDVMAQQKQFAQQTDEEVAAHKISVEEATTSILGNNGKVASSIQLLTAYYRDLIDHDKKLTSQQKQAGNSQLTTAYIAASKTLEDSNHSQREKAIKDDQAQQSEYLRERLESVRQFYANAIQLAKTYGQTQTQIAQLESEAEKAEYEANRAILQDKLTQAGRNAVAVMAAQDDIAANDAKHTQATIVNAQKVRDAKIADMDTVLKQNIAQREAENKQAQSKVTADRTSNRPKSELSADQKAANDIQRINLELTVADIQATLQAAEANGAKADVIRRLREEYAKYNAQLTITNAKDIGSQDFTFQKVFGDNRTNDDRTAGLSVFSRAFDSFGDTTKTLLTGFNTFATAGQAIVRGFEQGGFLGAAGAAATQIGSFLPGVAGQIVGALGSVMSTIGGWFTAAARRIAEDLKKQLNQTMKDYQNGDATLIQTINKVEAERQQAIASLSGRKGGQDQLDKLLPQFDDELAQLKQSQKQIVTQFEGSLSLLLLHNDAMADFVKAWSDVNKQVKDYIDAGGDVNKAQQFLSENLKKQLEDATDNYNEGYQTAIQDALNLNDLIQQRIDLIKQEKAAEFDILSADALERRQSGAITAANKLADQRSSFRNQLDDLNNQIDLAHEKFDLESKVYDINKSVYELHQLDNQMQLDALSKQLEQAVAYRDIMRSISVDSNGNATLTGMGVTIGQINVNTGGNAVAAQEIADSIAKEISALSRSGQLTYTNK